jgi:predicted Zn-dependent peptidase
MKNILRLSFIFLLAVSCFNKVPKQAAITQDIEKKFAYETVEGDPLKTRIYTLDNGFKVYMSVNKDKPRIQTYISVNAGSKNDPADATGLAHYLEHMLFKGSTHMGTINFEKEKVLLDQIENQYEVYRSTTDSLKRKNIYHMIDSLSYEASKYAIPNEYDRLISQMGATGTNAFTMSDQTSYVNNIPSNQLSNWLKLEYERFEYPVFRLFHTELEAVYEEKNIGLDSDDRQAYEALLHSLFLKHPYGTQTNIGTIEHLKNPSLKKIKEFYNTYYVPNNMALVMVGDFDMDAAIKEIDKTMGKLASKEIPAFHFEPEDAITAARKTDVLGADGEYVMMAYPFNAQPFTKDAYILTLIDRILNNAYAGLIDINLNQTQKVTQAGTYLLNYNDYTAHVLYAVPTQNQSLEQAQELLFEQLEKLKKGDFADWLIPAIVKNLRYENIQAAESMDGRARMLLQAFNTKVSYNKVVNEVDEIAKISKADIIAFCERNYSKNGAVLVYKKTSTEKSNAKVQKPIITPIQLNRENTSEFAKEIALSKVAPIAPVFVDFSKEIKITKNNNGSELWYVQNKDNQMFNINIHYDFGTYENPLLESAIEYLENLGTSKKSNGELHEDFYKIACEYSFGVSAHETNINVSGLVESMPEALAMIQSIFTDAVADENALQGLKMKMLKQRSDEKLNKETILWKAMSAYVLYGKDSPWLSRANPTQIKEFTSEQLLAEVKKLWNTKNELCYYGPEISSTQSNSLNGLFAATLNDAPAPKIFNKKEMMANEYYIVDYNMQQAIIGIYTKGKTFDPKLTPAISIFNEYFGGDMSSITFQEIREAKALAYSVGGSYNEPYYKQEPFTFWGSIGTQADKMPEALLSLDTITRKLPYSPKVWETATTSLRQNIETGRIMKTGFFGSYRNNLRLGYNNDRRKDLYTALNTLTFKDIEAFQMANLKDQKFAYLILGNTKTLNMKWLQKQGTVKVLTLEEIFGY